MPERLAHLGLRRGPEPMLGAVVSAWRWDGKYPVRARVIDAAGDPTPIPGVVCATPDASRPHIGKLGVAHLLGPCEVRIDLEDGSTIYGYECWWQPIAPDGTEEASA